VHSNTRPGLLPSAAFPDSLTLPCSGSLIESFSSILTPAALLNVHWRAAFSHERLLQRVTTLMRCTHAALAVAGSEEMGAVALPGAAIRADRAPCRARLEPGRTAALTDRRAGARRTGAGRLCGAGSPGSAGRAALLGRATRLLGCAAGHPRRTEDIDLAGAGFPGRLRRIELPSSPSPCDVAFPPFRSESAWGLRRSGGSHGRSASPRRGAAGRYRACHGVRLSPDSQKAHTPRTSSSIRPEA
jgi:hypothetical protein